jgi:hypothetical protein
MVLALGLLRALASSHSTAAPDERELEWDKAAQKRRIGMINMAGGKDAIRAAAKDLRGWPQVASSVADEKEVEEVEEVISLALDVLLHDLDSSEEEVK